MKPDCSSMIHEWSDLIREKVDLMTDDLNEIMKITCIVCRYRLCNR